MAIRGAKATASFALTDRNAWVSDRTTGFVYRIDVRTNRVVGRTKIGVNPLIGDTAPDGAVWIPLQGEARIARLDPSTGRVTTRLKVGFGPTFVNLAFGDLWIDSFQGDDIYRVRP